MARKLSGTYDKTEKCGCEVRWADDALVDGINFCPLHKAAPEMLEALKAIDKETASLKELRSVVRVIVHSAIAQARGQEVK